MYRLLMTVVVLSLVACSSSGPKTSYYTLFANTDPAGASGSYAIEDKSLSIGVGPVVLPEYLGNTSIVSLTPSQKLYVSGTHVWAGDLSEAAVRVLAGDLGQALALEKVWGFPWDNRVRPDYQLRIVVEEFSGVRGGQVNLRVKWTLLNKTGDTMLLSGAEHVQQNTATAGVDDYVAALNVSLHNLSLALAERISEHLN